MRTAKWSATLTWDAETPEGDSDEEEMADELGAWLARLIASEHRTVSDSVIVVALDTVPA